MKQSHALLMVATFLSIGPVIGAEKKDYYEFTESDARAYVAEVKKGEHHDVRKLLEIVSTKETAITLAIAVWIPIYGKEKIEKQAPYQVIRVDDCWVVTGSLEKGFMGGTAQAVINAADGCFLNVTHGK